MGFDWNGKQAILRKLYIEDNLSLDKIMVLMRDTYAFNPSKRTYQAQFKKWEFPPKHNPVKDHADLVARIKELWEASYNQREMMEILEDENYSIKKRELSRVRQANGWLLRQPNERRVPATEAAAATNTDDEPILALQQEVYLNPTFDPAVPIPTGSATPAAENQPLPDPPSTMQPQVIDQIQIRDQQRLDQLRTENDAKLIRGKRRRHTKSYAGMPADPPGHPRYPSELTIGASKVLLDLSPAMYREIRDVFEEICEKNDIIKKASASSMDAWIPAKRQLIGKFTHLEQILSEPRDHDRRDQALDIICIDVTKRMRTGARMTLGQAKKILKINPTDIHIARDQFYKLLVDRQYTMKLQSGIKEWNKIQEIWINNSPIIQRVLELGDADPEIENKKKALDLVCNDVLKRLHSDRMPANHPIKKPRIALQNEISTLASQALASAPIVNSGVDDTQIDPSLLQNGAPYGYSEENDSVESQYKVVVQVKGDSYDWLEEVTEFDHQQLMLSVSVHIGPEMIVTGLEGLVEDEGCDNHYSPITCDTDLGGYIRYVLESGKVPRLFVSVRHA